MLFCLTQYDNIPRYPLTSKKLFDDSEMIDVEIQSHKGRMMHKFFLAKRMIRAKKSHCNALFFC